MRWAVEGRFKRERTYICLWQSHSDIWQKPTQYCKTIILQLKLIKKKKRNGKLKHIHTHIHKKFLSYKKEQRAEEIKNMQSNMKTIFSHFNFFHQNMVM